MESYSKMSWEHDSDFKTKQEDSVSTFKPFGINKKAERTHSLHPNLSEIMIFISTDIISYSRIRLKAKMLVILNAILI